MLGGGDGAGCRGKQFCPETIDLSLRNTVNNIFQNSFHLFSSVLVGVDRSVA